MLLYLEVSWFLFLSPVPQDSNHNLNSAGFGLVIAEGKEQLRTKAKHDWRVQIHQKIESAGEKRSNCCCAPSLTACAERCRLRGGSYLRLLRLILLEIPISSHKAAPQGCQVLTAFSDSGGATSVLNFPTEIAVIYEFRRLMNVVSWSVREIIESE